MKHRPYIIGIVAVLAITLVMVVIVSQRGISNEHNDRVRIGVLLELTGPLAPYAKNSRNGMLLAATEIGDKIELVFEDAATDPRTGLAAFHKLCDAHQATVIVGAIGSSTVLTCATVANEREVVLFSAGATSPLVSEAGPFVFRNRLSGALEMSSLARLVYEQLDISSVTVLYVNNDYGVGNRDTFVREFQKAGGKIVQQEGFDVGSTEYRTLLSRASSTEPDCLVLIGHVTELARILKQAAELHLSARIVGSVGIEHPDLWSIAGNAADGVIYAIQEYGSINSSAAQSFNKSYEDRYGSPPDLFAALGYDAIKLLNEVMKKHGSDSETIRAELSRITYEGVLGSISFDENGDIRATVDLKIAQNGTFEPFKSSD